MVTRPASAARDSALLRYADPPVVETTPVGREWRAAVDCAPPVSLASLIGARVGFAFDADLDGVSDAADSLGISPADCGESAPGRIVLRRRFSPPATAGTAQGAFLDAAVVRATLRAATDTVADARAMLTAGTGSMLRIARFCARPRNGEPEWVELRNAAPRALSLARVRFEGRALAGSLAPGESVVAGSDTAELRVWQPGARILPLSSWSNLRNSGDTLRVTLSGDFVAPTPPVSAASALLTLDSLVYGTGAHAAEACASTGDEDAAAGAAGYALEFSTPRGGRAERGRVSSSEGFTVTVRAPAGGRYDLTVYDLDGRPLCVLARAAAGPATHAFPPSVPASSPCSALASLRAGRVIFHLSPRAAPGLRALLRVVP